MEDKKISVSVSSKVLRNLFLIFVAVCIVFAFIWVGWKEKKEINLHEKTLLRLINEDLRIRTYLEALDPNFEANMEIVEEVLQAKVNIEQ